MNIRSLVLALVGVALVAMPATAGVQQNASVPFAATQFISCANGGVGEMVELTGILHVLITATTNKNHTSGYMLFSPQGISGRGETTGALYHAVGMTGTKFETSLQKGQAVQSFVDNFDIIGQGPRNNFREHVVTHLTFNADGRITANVDDFRAVCN